MRRRTNRPPLLATWLQEELKRAVRIEAGARHPSAAGEHLQTQNTRQALLRLPAAVAAGAELVLGASEGKCATYRFAAPTAKTIPLPFSASLTGGDRLQWRKVSDFVRPVLKSSCGCYKPGKGKPSEPCFTHTFQPYVTLSDGSTTTLLEGGYLSDHHSDATELAMLVLHASGVLPPQMSPGRPDLRGANKFPFALVPKTKVSLSDARDGQLAGYSWAIGLACDAMGPNLTGAAQGDSRCLGTVWLCGKSGVDDCVFAEFIGFCEHACLPCSLCNTHSCATCAEANMLPLAQCTEGAGGLTGAWALQRAACSLTSTRGGNVNSPVALYGESLLLLPPVARLFRNFALSGQDESHQSRQLAKERERVLARQGGALPLPAAKGGPETSVGRQAEMLVRLRHAALRLRTVPPTDALPMHAGYAGERQRRLGRASAWSGVAICDLSAHLCGAQLLSARAVWPDADARVA
jgi:hypothetical protein